MRAREVDDALAVEQRQRIRDQEQRIGTVLSHGGEGGLEVVGLADAKRLHRDVKPLRGLLHVPVAQRHPPVVRVPEHRDPRRLRHRFGEELEALRTELHGLIGDAGHVAAGPREARDQADAFGVTDEGQHDRDRRGRVLGRRGRRASHGDDDVHLELDQLGRERGKALLLGVGPPAEVHDVLRLDVAQIPERLSQRQRWRAIRRPRAAGQESDAPRLAPRLRLGGERRRDQAERDADDEGAPVQAFRVRVEHGRDLPSAVDPAQLGGTGSREGDV